MARVLFTSPGSHQWVVPAAVTAVMVELVGGGGKGGAPGTTAVPSGGHGVAGGDTIFGGLVARGGGGSGGGGGISGITGGAGGNAAGPAGGGGGAQVTDPSGTDGDPGAGSGGGQDGFATGSAAGDGGNGPFGGAAGQYVEVAGGRLGGGGGASGGGAAGGTINVEGGDADGGDGDENFIVGGSGASGAPASTGLQVYGGGAGAGYNGIGVAGGGAGAGGGYVAHSNWSVVAGSTLTFVVGAAGGIGAAGGAVRISYLTLDDAEVPDGTVADFAALLAAGPPTNIYHEPDGLGSILAGDLNVGPDDVPLNVIRFRAGAEPGGEIVAINDADPFDIGAFFRAGGGGENAVFLVQTLTGSVVLPIDIFNSSDSFVALNVPAEDQAFIAGIGEGDRVIFGAYLPAPVAIPGPVTNLAAVPASGELALSWGAPAEPVTTYRIRWRADGTSYGSDRGADTSALAYTITGLPNGVLHDARVRAINAAGNGPWTQISATPAVPSVPMIELVAATVTAEARISQAQARAAVVASQTARVAKAARSLSGADPIIALEITHPSIATPVRIVGDTVAHRVAGALYPALAFRAQLPQEKEGEVRQASIEIDNIGTEMNQWVEASQGGRGATMRAMKLLPPVSRTLVDETAAGGRTFQALRDASAVTWEVTMSIGIAELTNEVVRVTLFDEPVFGRPAVLFRHDPETSPGLF